MNKLSLSAPKTELILFSNKHRIPHNIHIKIENVEIQLKENVKYLGFILNRKLNWKPHVEDKCKKAANLIFLIRRCTRLNWGPNTKILKSFFQLVVNPTILYGSSIWLQATSKVWCQNRLQSTQRLMAITIIRGFKTISSTAAILLANLIPLHLHAQLLASKYQTKQLLKKEIDATAEIKSSSLIINNLLVDSNVNPYPTTYPTRSDLYPLNKFYIPKKSYLKILPPWHPSACTVNHLSPHNPPLKPPQLTHPSTLFIYTDGSKTKDHVGYAAIAYNHLDQVWTIERRLEKHASIFEAESRAITSAIQLTLSSPTKYQTVVIFSDCQSALAFINSHSNIRYY